MAQKVVTIEIDGDTGKVVDGDRDVHVTTRRKVAGNMHQAADKVKWVVVSNDSPPPAFKVRFGSPTPAHPFVSPAEYDANGKDRDVAGLPGTYKYSVIDASGNVTDDPNVIIDK